MPEPIGFDEAVERVCMRARMRPLPAKTAALADATGRTLAADVVAPEDIPAFANSAMDGYAVCSRDVETAGAQLKLVGESQAGTPATVPVGPGTAVAISTGAVLPEGSDAVVRVEDTERSGDALVTVNTVVPAGLDVRLPGEDVHAGEAVLHRGNLIGPAELGVLAAVGLAEAPCARQPRVTVLVTGSELVEPGAAKPQGSIYNTNGFAVPAQIGTMGGKVTSVEHVADDRAATTAAVERGLGSDILVVCGGVSVGEHDHAKAAFAELGVEEDFWGVRLRPGHPTWFGATEDTLVFGLPGNPAAAMVTCELFVRPAVELMLGREPNQGGAHAVLDVDFPKKSGRSYAIRCTLRLADDGWHATPTKAQGSHILTSMVGADALAILPADTELVAAGDSVPFLALN